MKLFLRRNAVVYPTGIIPNWYKKISVTKKISKNVSAITPIDQCTKVVRSNNKYPKQYTKLQTNSELQTAIKFAELTIKTGMSFVQLIRLPSHKPKTQINSKVHPNINPVTLSNQVVVETFDMSPNDFHIYHKNNFSHLMTACIYDLPELALQILFLIEHTNLHHKKMEHYTQNVDLNHVDGLGNTALFYACMLSLKDVAFKIIEIDPTSIYSVNDDGDTPFIYACRFSQS